MEKYWDPISGEISGNIMLVKQLYSVDLDDKLEWYRQHPYAPRREFFLLALLPLIPIIYFIISPKEINQYYISILVLFFLPVFLYLSRLKKLEKSMAELLLAKENGWFYNPSKDAQRLSEMQLIFGEIFNKGDGIQYITNQYWGEIGPDKINFWRGILEYSMGVGKDSQMIKETMYAFSMPKSIEKSFLLTPQRISKDPNADITTESNDFNKYFHIEYDGMRNIVGRKIFEVLSPDTQEALINFRHECGEFSLLFKGDIMLVSFSGDQKLKYTSFIKKVAIDKQDKEELDRKISKTIEMGTKVLSCFD